MKWLRLRKLSAFFALACAGAQPALGSPLLGGSIALALHANDHDHSASLRSDDGHIDLVLSHGNGDDHDAARSDVGRALSPPERDHVFHITGDDGATAAPRRLAPGSLPTLGISIALPALRTPVSSLNPSPELCTLGVDHLRTVVLRL